MLDSKFLAPYRKAGDPFKSLLARSTYLGKYKRLEDSSWTDSVARVVLGSAALDPTVTKAEAEILFDTFWNGYGLPPGRGLWTGGVPGIPVSSRYNCWYSTIRGVDDWCFVADMLMCGGGVGVGLHSIGELPKIERSSARLYVLCSRSHANYGEVMPDAFIAEPSEVATWHVVDDSRKGWVEALRTVMTAAFEGRSIVVNVSSIRKRGAPLKTFGGIACGPAPLATLLRQVWCIIRGAQGWKLTSVEALDITNHIGVCIKSGNVRRSALIVLGDANDQGFRDAKKDWAQVQTHRHSSNNSIVFETEKQIDTFNWEALVEDNSEFGEPGILNLWKIRQTDPGADGVNPCFRADTRIHTKEGHFQIRDLVGKTVEVWDGETWRTVSTFQVTSKNEPMLKITLQDGSSFAVTHYHAIVTEDGRRIEAKDLKVGERLLISNAPTSHGAARMPGAYAKGFCVGDGTWNEEAEKPVIWVYPPKRCVESRLVNSLVEIPVDDRPMRSDCRRDVCVEQRSDRDYIGGLAARKQSLAVWCRRYKTHLPDVAFQWDLQTKLEFIAGYMDADGTASDTVNGFMYQVCSVEKKFLEDFQELLKTVGVRSHLSIMKRADGVDFDDGHGEYATRDCWRLTISQSAAIALSKQVKFSRLQSFADRALKYNLRSRFNKVVSIEADGVDEEVFCLVTDDPDKIACSNGLIIGRCGEVPLHDREACCLSEVYPALMNPLHVTRALWAVTRYTLRQRLETMEDRRADQVRRANMRIGVGLGGICDFKWTDTQLAFWQTFVRETANRYAEELDVPNPIAVTTVKPSGTISLLNGSSPGIHAPFADYYVRRTRIGKDEPMAQALVDAGVPHEPCVYDSTGQTLVFSFPMKSEAKTTVQTQTVREQIERQVAVQKHWADNAVSTTISFTEEEKPELAALLKKYAKDMKSISCLPKRHGYQQPPYETISSERYAELHGQIDHDHPLTAGGDLDTLECEGGACPIR